MIIVIKLFKIKFMVISVVIENNNTISKYNNIRITKFIQDYGTYLCCDLRLLLLYYRVHLHN